MTGFDALLVPRERPPDLLELKKALLTFDRIFLFEPDDREVIPPAALMMAASGGMMPIAFQTNAVLPLGKAPGFAAEFDAVAAMIDFGKAEGVIETITPPPDLSGQFIIGSIPLGPDTPNPTFVLSVLRHLATDQTMLDDAVSTAFPLKDLDDRALEDLAPNGSGHQEISTLPSPIAFGGSVPSEELRDVVTRLARARLGSVVRSLAVANNKRLLPITDDQGLAAVIDRLATRLETVDQGAAADEEERLILDRLGRLHRIVFRESFISADLGAMSLDDILRMRTSAWGQSQEHRQRLFATLREIALEEDSIKQFELRCQRELDSFRSERMAIQHDWTNLRIKIECTIGTAVTAVGSGVLQKMLGTGSLETLLLVGGVLFQMAGEYVPEIRNRLAAEREIKASTGYGLATPYRSLIR